MIEWSIDAFRACETVRAIVVAVPPDALAVTPADEHGLGGEDLTVLAGGATRARSVANAVAAVETELVAIHDAARPLLTPALVAALVARLDADPDAAGVIAAAPIGDTVKRVRDSGLAIEGTLDRARLWAAQTPQVFRTQALSAALAGDRDAGEAATDEAMLVEAAGGTVLIHPAGPENLKVTTPPDLRLAELLLAERAPAGPS